MLTKYVSLKTSALDPQLSNDGTTLKIIGTGSESVPQNFVSGYSNSKLVRIEFLKVTALEPKCCYAFKSIKEVIFDDAIHTIGAGCFQECSGLESITLPDSLLELSDSVFYSCTSLTRLSIGSKLQAVSSSALFGTKKLNSFNVNLNNQYFSTDSNHLFLLSNDKTTLYRFPGTDEAVEVPFYVETLKEYCASKIYTPIITFAPNSKLKTVNSYAFQYLYTCKTIEFPEGLQSISNQVFFQSDITSVYLPSSLTIVDPNVFGDAVNLNNVTIGPNHKSLKNINGTIYTASEDSIIFMSPDQEFLHIPAALESIPRTFISGAKKLKSITVNESNKVYSAHYGLLYNSDGTILKACPGGMKNAIIVESCKKIENDVLYKVDVESIEFRGKNLTYIGAGAISYTKLKSLKLPDGLEEIFKFAFQQNLDLSGEIVFPSSLKYVRQSSFHNCNLITKLDFHKCVELIEIDKAAFEFCGVKELILPPNLQKILSIAFDGTKITLLELPESVVELGDECFKDCTELSMITFLGNGIQKLPSNAFKGAAITSIVIPDSVSEISGYALGNCPNLKNVTFGIESKLSVLASESFAGSNKIARLDLRKNVVDIKPGALCQMNGLMDIVVSNENQKYESNEGILYEKGFRTIVAFPGGRNSGVIRESTTSIGQMAFYMCEMLSTLQFGKSQVEKIGASTFLGCIRLQRIEIPGTVSILETDAFKGCTQMKDVIFKAGGKLTELGSGVFTGCTSLQGVIFESGSYLKKIGSKTFSGCVSLCTFVSPPNVTEIGNQAFLGCQNLIQITFSQTLGEVSSGAFEGCTSLECVTIPSSVQWIGSGAFKNCQYLKTIFMCGENTKAEDDTVFDGVDKRSVLWTNFNFKDKQFGGLTVIAALDHNCHLGSIFFTRDVHIQIVFPAFVSLFMNEEVNSITFKNCERNEILRKIDMQKR